MITKLKSRKLQQCFTMTQRSKYQPIKIPNGVMNVKIIKKSGLFFMVSELLFNCIEIAKLSAHLWVIIAKNNMICLHQSKHLPTTA